jgi:hypothetical protein
MTFQASKRFTNRRKPLGEVDSNIHHRPAKRQRVIAVESESENASLPQGQNGQDTPEIVQRASTYTLYNGKTACSIGRACHIRKHHLSILMKSQVG